MFQTCAVSGLLSATSLTNRLDNLVTAAKTAYLHALDEIVKVNTENFPGHDRVAAETVWHRVVSKADGLDPVAPRAAREGPD